MSAIIPAIIPTSLDDLKEKLSRLEGICDEVQIDIVDGIFAKPSSWPYTKDSKELSKLLARGEMLPGLGSFRCEIDLMSADPETEAGAWIELGAARLTVHAESTRYIGRFLKSVSTTYGSEKGFAPDLLSIGLAIGADTDVALIEPFLDQADYVQFMGIRTIGHQGEPFDARVISRIKAFRKAHPGVPVQVDGGVSLQTAPDLLAAGVSRLVVGSALWKSPDLGQTFRAFSVLANEHGIYEV